MVVDPESRGSAGGKRGRKGSATGQGGGAKRAKKAVDDVVAVLAGLKDDQALQGYQVIHFQPFYPVHKRTEATVYLKIVLEGTPSPVESSTRDFKLSRESEIWKMQLNDIFDLAGASGKKGKRGSHRKKYPSTLSYHY